MNAILLESGSEENWDHILAAKIEQGMETPTVLREDIMKALDKE